MNILISNDHSIRLRAILNDVMDPEIPVLSITDLGIIRDVIMDDDEVEVIITPTYSGCPAMDMISVNIKMALLEHGYKKIKITSVLSPAWTTDWITPEGKEKMRAYGIAPPQLLNHNNEEVQCPQCGSPDTKLISQFGSTACKALYQCNSCREPFDHFKCH